MNPPRRRLLRRPDLWLPIILVSLSCAFPTLLQAALAGGGCTTTMTLTYVNGVQKWVCRVDPVNVLFFHLDVQWDPTRAQLDASSGVLYKSPFNQATPPILDQAGGRLSDIAGNSAVSIPGDVDIFELVFIDLQPGLPINQAPFTVFASSNDSISGFDSDSGQLVTFTFNQIASTTRSVTPGVRPHIWDPDGVYNSAHTGGPGTWNTVSNQWDDLPLPSASPTPSDTPWNNATHATDIAVFSGDPGNGNVVVQQPISVGGFRFDISGYDIQGSILTLSAVPGFTSTIDTGANNATIDSILTGNGFTKIGGGTLAVAGANTYTGTTLVNAGQLLTNNLNGSGTGDSQVSVAAGAVLGGSGAINGAVGIQTGGTIFGGSGKAASGGLTLANNLTMQDGAFLSVALGANGMHSSLSRSGGVWIFAPSQGVTLRNIGAQLGTYHGIITGLAADPGGVGSWTITNAGYAGTFSYAGAGNIDLNLTAATAAMQILSVTHPANNHIVLQCRGVPYQANTVQASPDLVTQFAAVASIQADSAGAFQYEDRTAGSFTKRFYRIVYP